MERAGDLLRRFFEQYNIGREGERYVSFFSSWSRISGRDLAAHSQIADIRHNAAVIDVDHPAWMQLLQMKQKGILQKMQAEFPDLNISSIQMRLVDRRDWNSGSSSGTTASSDGGDLHSGEAEAAGPPHSAEGGETSDTPEEAPSGTGSAEQQEAGGRERHDGLLERLRKQVEERDRERDDG